MEITYNRFFNELTKLEPTLRPKTIMIDFEKAAINALKAVFPATLQRGCFFHFCQNLYRSITGHGLKEKYENDPEFALKIRMLSALAFVPTHKVEQSILVKMI